MSGHLFLSFRVVTTAWPGYDAHQGPDANEPRRVATPMPIPLICQTATAQQAAASPSVAASTAAVAAGPTS